MFKSHFSCDAAQLIQQRTLEKEKSERKAHTSAVCVHYMYGSQFQIKTSGQTLISVDQLTNANVHTLDLK